MPSDFDLIIRQFPRKDIKIYPISDVHLGAAEHMAREWSLFTAHFLEDPDAYIILGGDLCNNATRNSLSNIFDETMRPREQKRQMVEMLMPLRDRILCAVTGNHERRSMKDIDDDPCYDIMCKLDLETVYRENLAFLKLQFGERNANGERNPTYTLVVTHGAGGGALTGGVVNRAERFGYTIDGADALILGHSHKPFTTQPGKIKVDPYNNKVTIRPFKVISMTSWLNYGGYAAQKMLMPTTHVNQVLTLRGTHKEMRVEM